MFQKFSATWMICSAILHPLCDGHLRDRIAQNQIIPEVAPGTKQYEDKRARYSRDARGHYILVRSLNFRRSRIAGALKRRKGLVSLYQCR